MKFSDRWHLAGIILREARLQGYLSSNPMYRSSVKENPEKIIRSIKSIALMNTLILLPCVLLMVIITITDQLTMSPTISPQIRLSISFGVFLLFCFGIMFFLNLLSTIGMFTTDLYTLPCIQPLSTREANQLFILAFVRMFIWAVIIMVAIYPIAMLILYGPIAAAVSLLGTTSTTFLSIGTLVLASKWFYQKAHSSHQSKTSIILRMLAGLGLVLGMAMAFGINTFLPSIIQFMEQISSNPATQNLYFLVGALFPFCYGMLLASVSNLGPFAFPEFIISLLTSAVYSAIAFFAFRKGGSILVKRFIGGFDVEKPAAAESLSLQIQGPIRAMIKRDLRLATRSLGTIVIFVFPFIMLIAIVPMMRMFPGLYLRSSTLLVALNYLQDLSAFIILSLIALDTQGSSILEGLPLGSSKVMQAKTVLYMQIHLLSCLVVFALVLLSTPITPLLLLMPLLQIPVGYAMASLTIVFVYRVRGEGRAVAIAVTSDTAILIGGLIICGFLGGLPLLAYGLILLDTASHMLALLGQGVISLLLFLLSVIISPHLLRD